MHLDLFISLTEDDSLLRLPRGNTLDLLRHSSGVCHSIFVLG